MSQTVTDSWGYERAERDAGRWRVAGVDEAGRGPLAGPVVAAAVILPDGYDISGIVLGTFAAWAKRRIDGSRVRAKKG